MDPIIENIKTRRSVRGFKPDAVEREKLEAVLEAGGFAPHGLALKTRCFTAVQGEKRDEANRCIRGCLAAAPITENTPAMIANTIKRAQDENADLLYGAPVLVIVSANEDHPGAAIDCATATQNMLLAANGLGLATCWLNQLPIIAKAPPVRALMDGLGIPADQMIYASFVVGYAAGEATRAPASAGKSSYSIQG